MAHGIDLGPLGERVAISPRRAAEALGLGVTKIYELLHDGRLTSYKEGKSRRILVSSIRDYIEARLLQAEEEARPRGDDAGARVRLALGRRKLAEAGANPALAPSRRRGRPPKTRAGEGAAP